VSVSEPVSVPVVPTWAVVPDPVLPSLADAPCVVSPELLSTAVALSPVVVLPPVNVDVALAEPLLASLSVVACDADSLADPPSVGAVVVAWEVVMVAPVASVASGPRLVEPALAEPPPAITTGRQDAPGGHRYNIQASRHCDSLSVPTTDISRLRNDICIAAPCSRGTPSAGFYRDGRSRSIDSRRPGSAMRGRGRARSVEATLRRASPPTDPRNRGPHQDRLERIRPAKSIATRMSTILGRARN
jgi:hypothetical protein